MPKMADFAHFEPPWSLNENFSRHPVCVEMSGIWSSFNSRSLRGGCLAPTGPTQITPNSPHLEHNPPLYIFFVIFVPCNFLKKENVCYPHAFLLG